MFAQALYFASFKYFGSKSLEYLVSEYTKKAKTVCFIGIQECFGFDQCKFLDLVRVLSTLDFTFLDTVLFVKVVETLLHHTSRKRKHFVSLKSKKFLAPSSGFWTLVRVSSILDSKGLDAVLNIKYAQTVLFVKVVETLLDHT